jgi:hypothetical protein
LPVIFELDKGGKCCDGWDGRINHKRAACR